MSMEMGRMDMGIIDMCCMHGHGHGHDGYDEYDIGTSSHAYAGHGHVHGYVDGY